MTGGSRGTGAEKCRGEWLGEGGKVLVSRQESPGSLKPAEISGKTR